MLIIVAKVTLAKEGVHYEDVGRSVLSPRLVGLGDKKRRSKQDRNKQGDHFGLVLQTA